MKRMGWATGSLAVIALLAACTDSGSKTLSEDDFVDELNSICNDADRDIRRLDATDRNFFDDALEIMQTGSDDLQKLKPPSDLADDFNDFVDNLDDTIKETENLRDAVDDEDDDAIADSQDELTTLAADGDELADSLGADDCVGIGGGTSTTDPTEPTDPDVSTPNTPLPIDTTVETTPEPTDPPITNPPATTATTPPTMPDMTVPQGNGSGEGLALDASASWTAPAGFVWAPLDDLAGVSTPYGDPVLGSVLLGYWAGLIQNPSTNTAALVYFSEVGEVWTDEQLDAILNFEIPGGGTDATTPLGLSARIGLGVADGEFDAGVIALDTNTVAIYTLAGGDVLGILDALYAANTMGG